MSYEDLYALLIAGGYILLLVGAIIYELYLIYRVIKQKQANYAKEFTTVIAIAIAVLAIYAFFDTINRLTILGLIIALLAFVLAVWQETENKKDFDRIKCQLNRIEDFLKLSSQDAKCPPDNAQVSEVSESHEAEI